MNILPPSNVHLSDRENPFTGGVAVDEFEDLFSSFGNSRTVTVTRRRARDSLDRFHLGVEPQTIRPLAASFVTSRWFESLTTSCVVVGKRPLGRMPIRRKYLMTSLY
jgi:hypothetical protein